MDSDYLLLTPGPLSTTPGVRNAMNRDVSTWDTEYNAVVQNIRQRLVKIVTDSPDCSSVLMQGSGTFGVEATIGSAVPPGGELLVVSNGAYGARMLKIADRLGIQSIPAHFDETQPADPAEIATLLQAHPGVTHVAAVHCETTSGMLNPVEAIGDVVAKAGRSFIVDAMSSFGGYPMSLESLSADYVISSANKCIQGVPGFSFVVARTAALEATAGRARSLALDLHDQWQEMETHDGKWRFTSPTHTVLAFAQALDELDAEGGVAARFARYTDNQARLVAGMQKIGFRTLLPVALQSPIITSFHDPAPDFDFQRFYNELKQRGFVIYPGKVTRSNTFRIGTIGDIHPADIDRLLVAVSEVSTQMSFFTSPAPPPKGPGE